MYTGLVQADVVELLNVAVQVRVHVAATASEQVVGAIAIEVTAGAVTVMVAVGLVVNPSAVAEITDVPAATPVIAPVELLMVATEVVAELHTGDVQGEEFESVQVKGVEVKP